MISQTLEEMGSDVSAEMTDDHSSDTRLADLKPLANPFHAAKSPSQLPDVRFQG